MIAPYNYQVTAPGRVTLPTNDLTRYGRSSNGILGHNFFQNPVVTERTYNPRMSAPLGNRSPRTTTTTTTGGGLPAIDMASLAGGAVKAFGPHIGAKLAQEGAKQGATGLSVIPAGAQGYYDSAGNYVSNIGTNLANTGKSLVGNLGNMTNKVGDYFSPEAVSDGFSYSNIGSSATPDFMPLSLGSTPQVVTSGGGLNALGGNVSTMSDATALSPGALNELNSMSMRGNPQFTSSYDMIGGNNAASMAGQVPQAGNYFWQPDYSFDANMQSTGYGTGAFAAGASLVGDVIAGGTGALKEADTWANSITSGVGAGIGMALGGPIGATVGSYAAKTVLGKWVGNAIDSVGDKIGEVGERIADFFGF